MVKIDEIGSYGQDLEDLLIENPDLEEKIKQKVILFRKNPRDTRIDNHPLTKNMEGKFAFSITDDIRIIYEWTRKTTVRFLAIGPHTKVYPKN